MQRNRMFWPVNLKSILIVICLLQGLIVIQLGCIQIALWVLQDFLWNLNGRCTWRHSISSRWLKKVVRAHFSLFPFDVLGRCSCGNSPPISCVLILDEEARPWRHQVTRFVQNTPRGKNLPLWKPFTWKFAVSRFTFNAFWLPCRVATQPQVEHVLYNTHADSVEKRERLFKGPWPFESHCQMACHVDYRLLVLRAPKMAPDPALSPFSSHSSFSPFQRLDRQSSGLSYR